MQAVGSRTAAVCSVARPRRSVNGAVPVNNFDIVEVPASGNFTATLWRHVVSTGVTSSVASASVTNCWPYSSSANGTAPSAPGSQPANSRISFKCAETGVTLNLLDDSGNTVFADIAFANKTLLAAGSLGVTHAVGRYGSLSIAGSAGWNGVWYYAAWNGGVLNANGQGVFSNTFECIAA